jgi:transcriptional regulator with XRE-family HTH domain
MSAVQPVFELLDIAELAQDIGRNLRLARAARGWRQEDLARACGASLQAIKNLEGGGNVEFMTFLKATKALGMCRAVWEGCKPAPQTLDELERMEHARVGSARVRPKE